MKKVFIISKYSTRLKLYEPTMVVDSFDRVMKYVLMGKGEFASLSKHPNDNTYTFNEVPHIEGEDGW